MNFRTHDLVEGILKAKIETYRQHLAKRPKDHLSHSALVCLLEGLRETTIEEAQAERARWYAAHRLPHLSLKPRNLDPNRRLKIGYASSEFRHHSAAYQFSRIMWQHDRDQFEVYAYSLSLAENDEQTEKFEKFADHWRAPPYGSHYDLAKMIRDDGIDILVDLSGHSPGVALPAFTMKPAPIQVHGWGSFNGTGCPEFDYILGDPISIAAHDRHAYTERIVDLPCALAYQPPSYAAKPAPFPVETNGYLTFGYLGRMSKIDDKQIALWARVLRAVPNSRMLFKCKWFDMEGFTDAFTARMAHYGITPDRLDMRGRGFHVDHLAAHNEVDVILDSLPNNGGMTTIEALWMGRPVVTLVEDRLQGRVGRSILETVGLGRFVAATEDEYFEIATRAERLLGIRQMVAQSPLVVDPVKHVEAAYRDMWRRWASREAARIAA